MGNATPITVQQFVDKVLATKGAQIITITTATEPKLKKTNPFGVVNKMSIVNGIINFNYEKSVNRQREREGIEEVFEVAPRQWGQRIPGTPFIEHNGKFYLTIKVEKTQKPTYVNAAGEEIPSEDLQPHLYATGGASRQGVEDQIITRDYSIHNITAVTMGGESFQIVQRGDISISPRA